MPQRDVDDDNEVVVADDGVGEDDGEDVICSTNEGDELEGKYEK